MPSQPSSKMATVHDWIEDQRQADLEAASNPEHGAMRELARQGVTPFLARLIRERDTTRPCGPTLEDQAEAAALDHLVGVFGIDRRNKREMAMARKQAEYARKLTVNFGFLETNLRRNLRRNRKRLDRKQKEYRPRNRRAHACFGILSPRQRQEAEQLWADGANHGLTWAEAMRTKPRENYAVYQRVRRILGLVTRMSTGTDI